MMDLRARWDEDHREDEQVVELKKSSKQPGQLNVSLVGKIVSSRGYNAKVVKGVMERAWRLRKDFTVTRVEPNIFEFIFQHPFDRFKALRGAPWIINSSWLILKE